MHLPTSGHVLLLQESDSSSSKLETGPYRDACQEIDILMCWDLPSTVRNGIFCLVAPTFQRNEHQPFKKINAILNQSTPVLDFTACAPAPVNPSIFVHE